MNIRSSRRRKRKNREFREALRKAFRVWLIMGIEIGRSEIETMLSRFQGAILGAAVGDAMTAPVQFVSRKVIAEQYSVVREMIGGGWLSLRRGQFSDDTQMMVCSLESIVEGGSFNVDHCVVKLLQWYKTRPKAIGKTTGDSLKRLSKGESWRVAAHQVYSRRPHSSAGNGALLRSLPIALRYTSDFAALISNSSDSAMITHADPMAASAVVLLNLMISQLVQSDEKDPRAYCIERLFGDKDNLWKNIFAEIDYLDAEDLIASGFVVDTIQSALWCFLKKESFEEAVVAGANLGEDAYGLTAVTGALAGAHYGIGKIPSRWMEALEHREALMALAEKLYQQIHQ